MPRRNSTRKKQCAVCGMEKRDYKPFRKAWVGKQLKVALRVDTSHFRILTIMRREREGAFQRTITAADVICSLCDAHHLHGAGVPVVPRSERAVEQAVSDAAADCPQVT